MSRTESKGLSLFTYSWRSFSAYSWVFLYSLLRCLLEALSSHCQQRGLWRGLWRVSGRGDEGVRWRTLQNPFKTPSRTLRKPFKKVSKSMMGWTSWGFKISSRVRGSCSRKWKSWHYIHTNNLRSWFSALSTARQEITLGKPEFSV